MSLSVLTAPLTTPLTTESHEEVNEVLNWVVGGGSLGILLLVMAALVAFGGGREHS